MKKLLLTPLIILGTVFAVWVTTHVFEIVMDMEKPEAMADAFFTVFGLVVAASWWIFINLPPRCEQGVCRPRDYVVVGVAGDLGIPGHETVLQCRCGRRYLRRGNRFLSVNERNYLEKYMIKLAWYSRWTADY
jgi:hypothetical protein